MRFKETHYSIFDKSINTILPESVDLKQMIQTGVKHIRIVLDTHKNDRLVHFSGSSRLDDKVSLNLSFNELYNQIIELTDDKLTLLVSLYNRINGKAILSIINTINRNEYFLEILSESNGYIIYHHQLEYFLINEMGFSEKEAHELRKSWNKKLVGETIKVISNKNYYKLKASMPFEFTFWKVIFI